MRTQAWNVSIQSIYCHQFDIFHRPCEWVTSQQHVWMLATAGKGLYYRRQDGSRNPRPVDPDGEALHYLAPGSWRFVDVCDANPLHLVTLRLSMADESGSDPLTDYRLPERFTPERQAKLAELMRGMLAEFERGTLPAQAEIRRRLGAFLGIVWDLAETRPGAELHRLPGRCRNAVARLRQNYTERLDIDRLAQLCSISRPHFFRLFREETGFTAQQYLCRLRLDHAKALLRFTDKSVAEIGRAVGWPDQFHFSRIFSRETGYSPMKFRNRNLT